jgi:dephospho-CoA kinase
MKDFVVIGVVGLPGSGKTEVAKVAAGLDIPCVRMGDVVWEEVKRRGLEINETNVGVVANELRRNEGLAAIAKRCIPLIERNGRGKKAVFIDGIRGIAEVEEFRNAFRQRFHLLGMWANQNARYRRITARGRQDDASGLRVFQEKDRRELSWGLGDALALADHIVVNESTLAELHKEAVKLLKSLIGGKT